jgi:hypothetical protein
VSYLFFACRFQHFRGAAWEVLSLSILSGSFQLQFLSKSRWTATHQQLGCYLRWPVTVGKHHITFERNVPFMKQFICLVQVPIIICLDQIPIIVLRHRLLCFWGSFIPFTTILCTKLQLDRHVELEILLFSSCRCTAPHSIQYALYCNLQP